ncbi:hypothetical protein HA402_000520 [Bradysia odoriphaga]|nr:hypothetical protein HA402_000520 [Bradysia odoriphaga]
MAEHVDSPIHLLYKDVIRCFFVNNKLILNNNKRIENGIRFLSERLPPLTVRGYASTAKSVKSVETTFMIKWGRGRFKSSDMELFFEENEKWVHTTLQLPSSVTSGTKEQRDKKNFDQLSERQKNLRVEDLVQNEIELLLLASAKAAKNANEDDLEHVLRQLYKNRAMATKIRSLIKQEKHQSSKPKKLEPLRAVSFLLDNKLSKSQYIETRLLSMEQEANIFPAYNIIRETKKECCPPADCFKLNDVSATLPFQELLDHTAKRLLQLQEPVISSIKNEGINSNKITVKLQVKWGSDGSSDHSRYNQKFVDVKQDENSDGNLFATTMVPLQIKTVVGDAKIIWKNTTPQSPRWCRPLRLHFAKEEDPFTIQELESVQREIDTLHPFVITISDVIITVVYELYLTMIDGKMLAVATKTKSKQACCICEATPKAFNNLTNIDTRFKPKPGTLNYGLSVLHLWIRCFEWLLHLSYRKDFEKWQRRGPLFKDLAAKRKVELQKRFSERMNLRVDFPSTKGTGNSNNGNVCRVAFSKPEELSKILDLHEELVMRVRTILVALSCQLPLDPELFEEFCLETARFYVKRYFWYPMPSSVHKMLIHSRDIILANELPVGVLAEDAAESCNKMYRHNRQFHARKDSRKHNLQDIFNRALDTSDPIIASFELRKRQNSRIRKNLPAEVLSLLKAPEAPTTMEKESEEVEEDSSDRNLEEFPEDLDGLTLPEDTHYSQYWDECEDEDSGNENKTDSCSGASETNDTGDEDNRDFI